MRNAVEQTGASQLRSVQSYGQRSRQAENASLAVAGLPVVTALSGRRFALSRLQWLCRRAAVMVFGRIREATVGAGPLSSFPPVAGRIQRSPNRFIVLCFVPGGDVQVCHPRDQPKESPETAAAAARDGESGSRPVSRVSPECRIRRGPGRKSALSTPRSFPGTIGA